MNYAENILHTIGNTPLVKLNKITSEIESLVLAKVESFNPGNSIKDRMAVKMVEDAAERMSHALVASSMLTDDGIIDPRDTRKIIAFCLSICNNTSIEGAKEYGVFRL